jgi:Tol biopolymer transport system component
MNKREHSCASVRARQGGAITPKNQLQVSLAHRRFAAALAAVLGLSAVLIACGGGGGGGGGANTPAPSNPAASGSVVYATVGTVNGAADNLVRVMNLSTKAQREFAAFSDLEGGVSVSQNGVVAQLGGNSDSYTVRLTQLDGTLIRNLALSEPSSFANTGVRISPDALNIAFSLNVSGPSGRVDAIYICNTQGPSSCKITSGLREPDWLDNQRVVALTESRKQLVLVDVATNANSIVGSAETDDISSPSGTPDGKSIVFHRGALTERVVVMDVASGTQREITSAGVGQYWPAVSRDGTQLLYVERCCGQAPSGPYLRLIAYNPSTVTTGGSESHLLTDAAGKIINVSGRFGHTSATIN